MWALFYDPAYPEEPLGEEVHKENLHKLCDLIIRDCTIQTVRYSAYEILSTLYINEGNIKKAEEICSFFPKSYFDTYSELLEQLYCRTDEKKYADQIRQNILYTTEHLVNKIRNFGTFCVKNAKEKISVYQKCLFLLDLIYDSNESGFASYYKGHIHCLISRLFWEEKRYADALDHMEIGLQYSKKYDDAMTNGKVLHTSLLLAGIWENLSDVANTIRENRMSYELSEFQTLDSNCSLPPEFYHLIDKYKPYAGCINN